MHQPSRQSGFVRPELNLIEPSPAARGHRGRTSTRLLLSLLPGLKTGALDLTTPDGRSHRYGPGGPPGLGLPPAPAELQFHDWSVAADALKGGDVGFAESFIDGRWSTPDLVQLLTVLAANQNTLERAFYGHWWTRALLRLKHGLRANTRDQARRNIVAHYDLGNAFYGLWLDPTMTYSSALFDGNDDETLEAAQHRKYERLLGQLELRPDAQVLEIGCGWGGFAETAARAGHRVTGISLSDAQTAFARARLDAAGLADRVTLRIQDYRDVRGHFDAVASIEMFEAVGERWWPAYFRAVRRALLPGGRACIQAITIAEDRFARYRTQSDFIQQYIFPGGMLATPSRIAQEARRAGLEPVGEHRFGRHYAETLKRWLADFDRNVDRVRELGFDERFIRCWRFYLAYCAAGFDTGTTDVGQYTFVRP